MSDYLYQCHSHSDQIIYVGITSNLNMRMRQHSEKAWFREVAWVESKEFDSREAAATEEAALIRELQPRYNKAHNPAARKYQKPKVTVSRSPQRPKLVPISEAAEAVSVSTRTIRRWISRGALTGHRVGPKLLRVNLDEVYGMSREIPTGGWS